MYYIQYFTARQTLLAISWGYNGCDSSRYCRSSDESWPEVSAVPHRFAPLGLDRGATLTLRLAHLDRFPNQAGKKISNPNEIDIVCWNLDRNGVSLALMSYNFDVNGDFPPAVVFILLFED